jgi:hypothetical protein
VAAFTALLDSNVLYSLTRTDICLQVARSGLFRARWSADIHAEWMRNLSSNRPDLDPGKIARRRDAMDASLLDPVVSGYEPLIAGLTAINPSDRHVLAAAIQGACGVIVTENLKHFPQTALSPHGIEAQHPDVFLSHQLTLDSLRFIAAVKQVRGRMKHPPCNVDEYLSRLRKAKLTLVADALEASRSLI